jgi:hypothetical protein
MLDRTIDHTTAAGSMPPNAIQQKSRESIGTLTELETRTRAH